MPASILDHLLPLPREYREIDNHHHLEVAATKAKDIEEYLVASHATLEAAAIANLRELGGLVHLQRETNSILGDLLGTMEYATDVLDDIHAVGLETVRTLREGFATLATQLFQQQAALDRIEEILRRPYETRVRELLRRTKRSIRESASTSGKERDAHYVDAMRLVDAALANPIGSTDYLAWFHKGWLLWKSENKLPEAQNAFFHAVRLSRAAANHYHLDSLRHLAHMHYLQKQYEKAHRTIAQAVDVAPADYDVLHDAARYAARAGHTQAALAFLERCIELRPETIRTMFAEQDFLE